MIPFRVELRRLRDDEFNHELIWLLVTVGAVAGAAAWFALHLPRPICAFRTLTGLPCATCGGTRSLEAFLHGHLGAAWRFNPLVLAGICAGLLFDLYALAVLSTGARRLRLSFSDQRARKLAVAAVVTIVLLNWIYLLRQ